MTSALSALGYVVVRTSIRRAAELVRSPLRLTLLLAALAALVLLQSWDAPYRAAPAWYAGAIPVVGLGVFAVSAVLRCPVRLRTADVAWILPLPNGPRALMLYK